MTTKILPNTFLASIIEHTGPVVTFGDEDIFQTPGNALLIYPYWYQFAKSQSGRPLLINPRKSGFTVAQIEGDLLAQEIIADMFSSFALERDLTDAEVQEASIRMVCAKLPPPVEQFQQLGDPEEGDYIEMLGNLYAVKHAGKLKPIGETQENYIDLPRFPKDFARLTGLIAIIPEVASTNEEIEEALERMPEHVRERFLQQVSEAISEKLPMPDKDYERICGLWDDGEVGERKPAQEVTLPDEAGPVKAFGCRLGLRTLYNLLQANARRSGQDLSGPFLSNFPVEIAEVTQMAKASAKNLLDSHVVNVNDAEQYINLFAEGYVRGHLFASYAIPHGLFNIYRKFSFERGGTIAHHFAWFTMYHLGGPDCEDLDAEMVEALDQIEAIYKQYQALN